MSATAEQPPSAEQIKSELAVSWLKAAGSYHDGRVSKIDQSYTYVESNSPVHSDGSGDADLALTDAATEQEITEVMSREDEEKRASHEQEAGHYEQVATSIEHPTSEEPLPSDQEIAKYALAEEIRQSFIREHGIDPIAAQIGLI